MMSPFSKRLTVPLTTSPIALVVLGEDVLALGLAHLLEDHLLGGLRGDAAEHFGRLRELHLVAELDAVGDVVAVELAVHLARLVDGDLGGRRWSRPATTVFSANRSTWPVSRLKRVFRFSLVL